MRTMRSELATFFEAFPNATVWVNTRNGEGYDMVFMGQAEPLKINVEEIQQHFSRPDYAPVAHRWPSELPSVTALFATYTGRKADLGHGPRAPTSTAIVTSYSPTWRVGESIRNWRM